MLRIPALAAIAKVLLLGGASAAGPNVVLVISEGQAYGDLSPHGSPRVKTPALDRFRSEATSLDRFHASPTGAPTRAALLTGAHEFRCGVSHSRMGRSLLRPGIATMPEMFRAAGYRTGIFGKWQLGEAYPCRPEDRGFDEVFVHGGGGVGQVADYWGNSGLDPMIRRRGGWEKTRGFCTDVFFSEAIHWLGERAAAREPFFLLLAPDEIAPGSGAAVHARIGNIDDNFAKLMASIEASGLAAETIVVFTSDQGSESGASPAGMKEGRPGPDEGRTRVPCFLRWPGEIAAGRVVPELAAHLDLLPTLTGLCGIPRPAGWRGDGIDLSAALLGRTAFPAERLLFTQVGHWRGDEPASRFRGRDFAVRDARWRLVGLELFDMGADPGQTRDMFAERQPEALRLLAEYGRWWDDVLPVLREPVRYVVGDEAAPPARLTAHDWWPSKETEAAGSESCVTQAALREFLTKAQVAATRNPLPSTSGHWKLHVARAGSYEVGFGLLPPEASAAERQAMGGLRPGVAHLRAGQEELQLRIQPGASSFRVPLDLDPGPLDLEIWFDGQLLNDRILGAFFASLERKGPRKAPKPEFQTRPRN
jgi:arylsulfatase A-like enzyme